MSDHITLNESENFGSHVERTTNGDRRWWLTSSALGGLVWVLWCSAHRPSLWGTDWVEGLVMLAALVHVPLGLNLLEKPKRSTWQAWLYNMVLWTQLPAALLLLAAFHFPIGLSAALLTLPWFMVTLCIATWGLLRLTQGGWRNLADFCCSAGCLYISVAGAAALISRFGARPLEFDGLIVLLTVIHYHSAGFLLPLMTGLAVRSFPGRLSRMTAWLTIPAIALVAVGIVVSHLRMTVVLEWFSACLMALAGMLNALLFVRLAAGGDRALPARCLWGIAALALLAAMGLAALYGLRETGLVPRLDISWMIATHGTLNAWGTCLAGILGWQWRGKSAENRYRVSSARVLSAKGISLPTNSETRPAKSARRASQCLETEKETVSKNGA